MKLSELANHILEVGSSENTMIKWFGSGIKIQEKEDWAEKDARCFLISRGTLLVRIDVATDDVGSNFLDIECIKREILKKENKSRLVREMGIIDDLEATKEKRVKCQDTRCGYEKSVKVKQDGSIGCGGYVWCQKCGSVMFPVIDKNKREKETSPQELMQKAQEVVEEAKKHDVVNHPKHYTQGKVECIDALESATINKRGIEAVCTANIIKYLWRYESKNGIEDVKKAQWYLDRLIEKLNELEKE